MHGRIFPDVADPVVYLLQCADGSLYCGWTTDLARRVRAHERGVASRYTRARLPVSLAGSWPVRDRSHALRTEAAIKRLPRARKLALVAGEAPPGCDELPGRPPSYRP